MLVFMDNHKKGTQNCGNNTNSCYDKGARKGGQELLATRALTRATHSGFEANQHITNTQSSIQDHKKQQSQKILKTAVNAHPVLSHNPMMAVTPGIPPAGQISSIVQHTLRSRGHQLSKRGPRPKVQQRRRSLPCGIGSQRL